MITKVVPRGKLPASAHDRREKKLKMAVQWLRLHVSNTRGTGSIPGRGTKILQAAWYGQKRKKAKNTTN